MCSLYNFHCCTPGESRRRLGGPALHRSDQESLRTVYRFKPIALILLFAVATQIITSLSWVIVKKRPSSRYDRMHPLSGLYLAFFLCIHLGAVMATRLERNVKTDFNFAVWGIYHPPNHYSLCLIMAWLYSPSLFTLLARTG